MAKLVVLCAVLVLVATIEGRPQESSTEPSTWEKIKKGAEHGFKVAYDETHCAFHKIKELVKPHDHEEGSDPCLNKPYEQPTTKKTLTLEETTLAQTV